MQTLKTKWASSSFARWLRLAAPIGLGIGLLAALFGALAQPAQAATCVVPSGSYATIQAAINDSTCTIITVASGTYPEHLVITRSLEIDGTGLPIVDGSLTGRVVDIQTNVTVLISGTILQRGSISGNGGGISNKGQLTLVNSQVLSNTAKDGGGIYNTKGLTTTNVTIRGNVISDSIAYGGGIYNLSDSTLSMLGSLVVSNVITASIGEGGGINNLGTASFDQTGVAGNRIIATTGMGGGLYNLGTATATQTALSSNVITGLTAFAGGLYNLGTASLAQTVLANNIITGISVYGGGLLNGSGSSLTIVQSQVTTNTVTGTSARGGGLSNSGRLTATGVIAASNLVTGVSSFGGGLSNETSGNVLWTSGELASNTSDTDGAGIYNQGALDLRNGNTHDNHANVNGGGIRNTGALTATNARLDSNTASDGAGLYNTGAYSATRDILLDNAAADDGGGVYNASGSLRLTESTFNGNAAGGANGDGAGINAAGGSVSLQGGLFVNSVAPRNGGGIYASSGITLSGVSFDENEAVDGGAIYMNSDVLSATNITLVENFGSNSAGALYLNNPAQAHLVHATVASHTVGGANAAGIVVEAGAALTLTNSIMAGNENANCDILGSFTETGTNLESADTCGLAGPLTNTNPLLGPLAFNGGAAATAALKTGSPALDAAALAQCASTDARGVPRPQGAGCDLGAYEALYLAVADIAVLEGGVGYSVVGFTVTVGSAVPGPQTVTATYTLAGGTATPGVDFAAANGTVVIPAGQFSKVVTATVLGDLDDEVIETFTLTLANLTRAVLADGQAIAYIIDDDGPEIAISDTAITEGTGGLNTAFFTVTLSAPSVQTITVQVNTADSGANGPADYTSVSTTLVFAPGVTSLAVGVPIVTDADVEADETFFVGLSSPVDATIADSQGLGIILNDDQLSLLYLPLLFRNFP